MTKQEFIEYTSTDNEFGQKITEKHIRIYFPEIYSEVNNYNMIYYNNKITLWKEKLTVWLLNIDKNPKCCNEHCNNDVNFNIGKKAYSKFCSNRCAQTSSEIVAKKIETTRKNFNVDYPMQCKEVQEKSIETCLKNYGVENPSQSKKITNLVKKTSLKKYGVDNHSKTKHFRNFMHGYHSDRTINSFSEKLNIDPENIEIIDDYYVKIKNYCPVHKEFTIRKDTVYGRVLLKHENICIECNPISETSSIKELEIKEFIEEELSFVTKKILIENKEIDIFIPELNIGVEHNGIYWHSEIYKKMNYHLDKTELCKKNDIQLIHIFEDEWTNKKEIVKSILRAKLGKITNKIFARKCKIVEIKDNKLIREFLETNHIQGFVGSNVKLGLFYENELVSLMTFGKKRVAMGNKRQIEGEYEMLRFCNKLNTNVIGGASKLLKYFIRNYTPKSILTYADRRYSTGDLYVKLGFEHVGDSKPNYWYVHKRSYKRHYRFKFRKDVLVKEGYDPTKTEIEIMSENGYYKIHDCGNHKYLLNIT